MAMTPSAWVKQVENNITHILRAGHGRDTVSMGKATQKRRSRTSCDNGMRPTATGTLIFQLKIASEVLQSMYNLDMQVANKAHFCVRRFHARGLTRLSMPNRAWLCSVVL